MEVHGHQRSDRIWYLKKKKNTNYIRYAPKHAMASSVPSVAQLSRRLEIKKF